jgi:hypothetical protein
MNNEDNIVAWMMWWKIDDRWMMWWKIDDRWMKDDASGTSSADASCSSIYDEIYCMWKLSWSVML